MGKQDFFQTLDKIDNYSFSVGTLVDKSRNLAKEEKKVEIKHDLLLTIKIFADKQYDYDQNIYLAEGNVKTIINGGILRSDKLSYEKLTNILSAEGNVSFTRGGQYFKGKEFRFNLLDQEGIIKDTYGILDLKNVLEDLKLDYNLEKILEKNKSKTQLKNNINNAYSDGIEFTIGNITFPNNKITRSNKSIGSINNWRFKSDLINIKENGWTSDKINFTNDPFDPHQISFEAIDVIAEEVDDKLLITSSKTNLILERRTKIFLGKRIFGDRKKKKSKYELIFDGKDRDGVALIRRSDNTIINDNMKFNLQPQFLINRAIKGKTNSYGTNKSKDIKLYDLLGLDLKLNANYKDWNFESENDISTLNQSRIFDGLRHSSSLSKYFKIPILNYSTFDFFTSYRSRAWNGTIGETEIKSAYGGLVEKNKYFEVGKVRNNFNLRMGAAKYKAEKLKNSQIINLWRSSIFASLGSEYDIWKVDDRNNNLIKSTIYSPISISPELLFRTNINSAYFKYEDGSDQIFLSLNVGPEIRLGKLERSFLDYTKLSVMPGLKIKTGDSPFKFDNAIDLKTLNISFLQQIYGPLMFDMISNLNIDKNSINYGKYYDTKLGLLWHKRAYEFGIYYHPSNDAGGFYFRINGFGFDNSIKPVF